MRRYQNCPFALESIGRAAPARERDAIVDAIVSALSPVLSSIRPDSVDYDYLSEKLSQAVKPNISQLIDLASDKRETAALIVEQLIPLLPNMQEPSPAVDTDAISLQLTSAVHPSHRTNRCLRNQGAGRRPRR